MTEPRTPAAAPAVPATSRDGRFARIPIHWLLFAAYPVLFLYSQNLGELTPEVLVVPLLVLVALAAVAMLVLARVLDVRRAAIIVSGAVVLLALFGPISDNLHKFLPQTALRLGIVVLLGALVVLLALRLRGGLGTTTLVLNLLSLVLVLFAVIPIGQQVVGLVTAGPDRSDGSVAVVATGPGTDRDIWWVILDRYGSDASIKALYGITDNDFGSWLEGKGFHLVEAPRANYVRTSLSIASTLHMSHLDELAARLGPTATKYGPIDRMLLDHPVGRFLQSQGYHYTQLASWFPQTRDSTIADTLLRPGVSADFSALVWNATIFPAVERFVTPGTKDAESDRAVTAARYQWDQFDRLCRQVGHNFVFAHVLLPHPPYVFHADGSVAPPGKTTTYDEQMRYTNTQMEKVVSCLQDRPADQQPIIILQADEGPYPPRYAHDQIGFDWSQATPAELLAKYGILDAWYLPGLPADTALPYPGMTSVNTFRWLFDHYFGADLPLLPDQSYTSPKLTPYDLLDVTDRIPAPDASLDPVPRDPEATRPGGGKPGKGGSPTGSPAPDLDSSPAPSHPIGD